MAVYGTNSTTGFSIDSGITTRFKKILTVF
jgi:hypothetical protein